ncbi:YL1 nuclear protein-domain-containing protein [Halenospora varia]|nr:YL1 nuclear protein-domain-containing protein [Halenospora varia]
MADEDTVMRSEDESSGSGSDSEEQEQEVEWLATSRQKRSTAGNRMQSLLQQEDDDDLVKALFEGFDKEEPEDEVFEDEEAQSDVQMDSSDDDDQGPEAGDDLEGEKELQKQAKAEARKKRKLNDGIPKIPKRRVKIDPTISQAPAPRPKKKSERASWIPTAEDAPIRASARQTTRQRKEELMEQMVDREIKRQKTLANMEKAAARKAAAKKPPMTQADRLREAAKIEKANAKSLNRWEEAEQQREEEQRERLAALHNRTMEGPVITWWSGIAEWVGGKLRKVGQLAIDAPKERAKKRKASEMEADEVGPPSLPAEESTQSRVDSQGPAVPNSDPKLGEASDVRKASVTSEAGPTPPIIQENGPKPSPILAPPPINTPPPPPAQIPPPEPPRASSVLAPPPMHGPYPPPPNMTGRPSSVLAPPPMTATPPPPPPFKLAPPIQPAFDGSTPLPGFGYNFMAPNIPMVPNRSFQPPPPPQEPSTPPPPAIEHAAVNYVILQNFDETAIKDKDVQTQILMNRKFPKAAKSKHKTELCAITSYPAKYRDPNTGLAYCNSFAYKEIQKLKRGEYKWSKLVGAYMGMGTYAARGVPARFMNPDAPRPETPAVAGGEQKGDSKAPDVAGGASATVAGT